MSFVWNDEVKSRMNCDICVGRSFFTSAMNSRKFCAGTLLLMARSWLTVPIWEIGANVVLTSSFTRV